MTMTMTDPRELFLHELGDVLYAERTLAKALPELGKEATDPDLAQGFEHHLAETKQQIANLERVFEALGEEARAERCPGMDGIKREHDEFMKEARPSEEICDVFLTGAAARTEHYEIAAYNGLIDMAEALGEQECARILRENLGQEEAMLRRIESSARRLLHEAVGAGAATKG